MESLIKKNKKQIQCIKIEFCIVKKYFLPLISTLYLQDDIKPILFCIVYLTTIFWLSILELYLMEAGSVHSLTISSDFE